MGTRFYVLILLAIVLCQTGCTNNGQTVESNSPNYTDGSLPTSEESPQETPLFIIDVRSKEEWDAGHLDQAIFIPHEDISEMIAGVTEDKSAKLVLY